jgi:hypothetical protein
MNLNDIATKLSLQYLTPEIPDTGSVNIAAGHASDLLSDVLANAPGGGVLVTIQVHLNVIAVAVHAGLAAVIFGSGRTPEASVKAKAVEEGIRLYVSKESTFDVVGRLYELGVKGHRS